MTLIYYAETPGDLLYRSELDGYASEWLQWHQIDVQLNSVEYKKNYILFTFLVVCLAVCVSVCMGNLRRSVCVSVYASLNVTFPPHPPSCRE